MSFYGQEEEVPGLIEFDQKFERMVQHFVPNTSFLHLSLHAVLMQSPSVDIVSLLMSRISAISGEENPEELLDRNGRNALHVAMMVPSTDPNVTKHLLGQQNEIQTATRHDNSGRLPLHYACDHAVKDKADEESQFQNICLLLNAYPMAVSVTDRNGDTPYSLAMHHSLSARILLVLKCALETHCNHLFAETAHESARLPQICSPLIKIGSFNSDDGVTEALSDSNSSLCSDVVREDVSRSLHEGGREDQESPFTEAMFFV